MTSSCGRVTSSCGAAGLRKCCRAADGCNVRAGGRENGKPLRGIVRNELVVDKAVPRRVAFPPRRSGQLSALASKAGRGHADHARERGRPAAGVPRDQWKFVVTEVDDRRPPRPVAAGRDRSRRGPKPGYIYEVVYEAEGPVVQGVGLAGIRDLVSSLKYDDERAQPAARRRRASRWSIARLGFGVSQSGRFLRHFLYDGFNADEQGRQGLRRPDPARRRRRARVLQPSLRLADAAQRPARGAPLPGRLFPVHLRRRRTTRSRRRDRRHPAAVAGQRRPCRR